MKITKFQQGGNIPAQAPAAPQQDPLMAIAELFAQGLQNGDCQLLAQGAEAFLGLLQQAQAPSQAPVGQVPEGQPVFKKGGKLVSRKKNCRK